MSRGRMHFTLAFCLLLGLASANGDTLPTLYEYYTSGGIKSGLEANHSDHFTLNGKPFIILGGSFHYFRVVPQHWRSRLLKMKSAGLNVVDLYVAWNLHELYDGVMDFNSTRLNLATFFEEIKQADMFAMVRPGPYICSEWELGGLPSWLLKDEKMRLRTNYAPFVKHVDRYMSHVMEIVNRYQFSNGGPVIMLQLENEYFSSAMPTSVEYIRHLHDFVRQSGFKGLLFTSDSGADAYPIKDVFPQHDVLETANLWHESVKVLTELKRKQVGKPAFVSEFWSGIQDFWRQAHHQYGSTEDYQRELEDIIYKVNGSANFYMFSGGTNFGFLNGARIVTSYDFLSPLTEWGNYTARYHMIRRVYLKAVEAGKFPKTRLPDVPPYRAPKAYGSLQMEKVLPFEELLKVCRKSIHHQTALSMEQLGQNFGFILYRMVAGKAKSIEIVGSLYDRSIFYVDQHQDGVYEQSVDFITHNYNTSLMDDKLSTHTYDVLVENQGRENFGSIMERERKGLYKGQFKLNDKAAMMDIYLLDFNASYIEKLHSLSTWIKPGQLAQNVPAMYSATLKMTAEPEDTFVYLPGWTKGNVFVNGFNLGRYWDVGPQKTLYLPGPLLRKGDNRIDIFELHTAGQTVHFVDQPMFGLKPTH